MTPLLAALLQHFITLRGLASRIDHTNLSLDATEDDIRKLCAEAKRWGFASVCVRPNWVPLAYEILHDRLDGPRVKICTVVSFHRGADPISAKEDEARWCIENGADEVDWVFTYPNISRFYGVQPVTLVHLEVEAIARLAQEFSNVTFKVIVECCALSYLQKVWICELLVRARTIQFIKTSTGFGEALVEGGPTGATVQDVGAFARLIAESVSPMQVKASGGIRDLQKLLDLADAGATRFGIGHASAIAIMDAARAEGLAA